MLLINPLVGELKNFLKVKIYILWIFTYEITLHGIGNLVGVGFISKFSPNNSKIGVEWHTDLSPNPSRPSNPFPKPSERGYHFPRIPTKSPKWGGGGLFSWRPFQKPKIGGENPNSFSLPNRGCITAGTSIRVWLTIRVWGGGGRGNCPTPLPEYGHFSRSFNFLVKIHSFRISFCIFRNW